MKEIFIRIKYLQIIHLIDPVSNYRICIPFVDIEAVGVSVHADITAVVVAVATFDTQAIYFLIAVQDGALLGGELLVYKLRNV